MRGGSLNFHRLTSRSESAISRLSLVACLKDNITMQFVAHAPTRAASTLMSMPVELQTGVETSLDAARTSACATVTIWLRQAI
jgi:hypothetical protein